MPFLKTMMIVAACALAMAEDGNVIEDHDWCRIEVPSALAVGVPATCLITVKALPPGAAEATQITFDLHWKDAAGKAKGLDAPGGAKPIEIGKPIAWKVTPKAKPNIGSLVGIVYLSKDGSWASKMASDSTKPLPLR